MLSLSFSLELLEQSAAPKCLSPQTGYSLSGSPICCQCLTFPGQWLPSTTFPKRFPKTSALFSFHRIVSPDAWLCTGSSADSPRPGLPVPQGLTFGRTSPRGCSPAGLGGPSPVHAAPSPPSPPARSSPCPGCRGLQPLLLLHPQLPRAAEGGSWSCTEQPFTWTGREPQQAPAARAEPALVAGERGSWGGERGEWESCLGPAASAKAAGVSCG